MSGSAYSKLRKRPLLVVVAALGLAAAGTGGGILTAVSAPFPPPVPPQSSPPMRGCTGTNPGIGGLTGSKPGWSLLAVQTDPLEEFADPEQPCLVYQAADAQTIRRSTDGGATFSTVLHDGAAAVPGAEPACALPATLLAPYGPVTCNFRASSLGFPGRGRLLLSEGGNGDAMLASDDRGSSWHLSDSGIEGQQIEQVVPAPGDPKVAYALAVAAGGNPATGYTSQLNLPLLLFRSTDGGSTWLARALPPLPFVMDRNNSPDPVFAVDPANSARLWVAWPVDSQATGGPERWDLFESDDGGTSWTDTSTLPPMQIDPVVSLVAIRSPRHPLRLVASAYFAGGLGSDLAISDDGGHTWKGGPLRRSGSMLLAVDPAHPDTGLAVPATGSDGLTLAATQDGFDTVRSLPPPDWTGVKQFVLSWAPATTPLGGQPSVLQGLRDGTFIADMAVFCGGALVVMPVCPQGVTGYRSAVVRINPAAALSAAAIQLGISGTAPVAVPMVELLTCPLVPDANGIAAGTVAYDGHSLLYTHEGEYGPTAYHGVIHPMDPTTCLPQPDIVVAFSREDLLRFDQLNPPAPFLPPGTHSTQVFIRDMAYDGVRNVIWATIETDAVGIPETGLFAITVDRGGTTATAHLAIDNGCFYYLTHDWLDDSLWTCDWSGREQSPPAAELSASTGDVLTSCAAAIGRVHDDSNEPAAWTMVGPHRLGVEMEDDQTLVVWDTQTCRPVGAYLHRIISEPLSEDEQVTCDALSFGASSATGNLLHGTALWVRDAQAASVSAYLLPGGACPDPTAMTYAGPPNIPRGSSAQLLMSLVQRYPGGSNPLSLPVTLTLQGPTTVVLRGKTVGGQLSIPWSAQVPAGRYHVLAAFDPGTAGRASEYLPSSATGQLDVTESPALAIQPALGLVPPAPAEPAAPPGVSQPTIAEQVQAQLQSQSQVQTQAAAQPQPAAMVQRREQRQVATQTAAPTQLQVNLATRRRSLSTAAAALDLAAAAVVLGFAFLAGRPGVETARRRRRAARAGRRPWDD